MEHYDWNDGWQFTPVFDPAIVRPESPELELEEVPGACAGTCAHPAHGQDAALQLLQ